jgi:hypothetical protein
VDRLLLEQLACFQARQLQLLTASTEGGFVQVDVDCCFAFKNPDPQVGPAMHVGASFQHHDASMAQHQWPSINSCSAQQVMGAATKKDDQCAHTGIHHVLLVA